VTRTLWGDLSRDVRAEDADSAEELAQSVARRVRRANNGLPRLVAFGSRASLRDPYTYEVPNVWRARARRGVRSRLRILKPAAAVTVLVVGLAAMVPSCARTVDLATAPVASRFPPRLVPDALDDIRFVRESALEKNFAKAGSVALVNEGRVFSVHQGDDIQGSVQIATFKPGLDDRENELRRGMLHSIGAGRFELTRIANERVYILDLPEQRMLLWLAPNRAYYQLVVSRKAFAQADEMFVRLLAYQRTGSLERIDTGQTTPLDPRRGIAD
jgi:hypothetical protein